LSCRRCDHNGLNIAPPRAARLSARRFFTSCRPIR
jgi:hypothetical protein